MTRNINYLYFIYFYILFFVFNIKKYVFIL